MLTTLYQILGILVWGDGMGWDGRAVLRRGRAQQCQAARVWHERGEVAEKGHGPDGRDHGMMGWFGWQSGWLAWKLVNDRREI